MSEFDDMAVEVSDNQGIDISDTSEWTDFDFVETDEVSLETAELPDATNATGLSTKLDVDKSDIQSESEKAADYARSYGFDKAADYIQECVKNQKI